MSTTSPPAESAASLPTYRFTVEEYRRLGEAGILHEDHRVELLEGLIVKKMNLNPPHSVSVQLCFQALAAAIPSGWHTRIQDPITTTDSEPEPDLAVVRGEIRDYAQRHPTGDQVALVVEVADSSLTRDHYKRTIYARAGIASYWIVNLSERKVETYGKPSITKKQARYQEQRDYTAGEQIPLRIEGQQTASIQVEDLLT